MCFMDLQNDYGPVDGTLLWQVLPRIGVRPQMIAVIRKIHGGMGNCARPLKIQRRYGHPHRSGSPEGTAGVNGTEAGYGLRSS